MTQTAAERLLAQRQQKDDFFRRHPQSPLSDAQQAAFTGLRYYPYNPALDLVVTVTPFAEQTEIVVETTTGDQRHYTRYGEFRFSVGDASTRLTLYDTPHGWFLPFVDAGANRETYGAGRYLEPDALPDGTFHIDFNLAYNPYCAYNSAYSCPLTPPENRLSVAILAGEMLPEGEWVGLA
jgi:uncharacterized protein (DUF1684 family)